MKKIIYLCFLIFTISSASFGQAAISTHLDPIAIQTAVKDEQWKSGSGTTTSYSICPDGFKKFVGYNQVSPDQYTIKDLFYRSLYKFDLSSIPSTATITNATIHISNNGTPETKFYNQLLCANIGILPSTTSLNSPDGKATYNSAVASPVFKSDPFGITMNDDITSTIIDHRADGCIIFAGNSNIEAAMFTAQLTLSIDVTYCMPFSVTFDNNLGVGTMGIVGPGINNPSATLPYTKTNVNYGDQFTLSAPPTQLNSLARTCTFFNWGDNLSTSGNRTITATQTGTIRAMYSIPYQLTFSNNFDYPVSSSIYNIGGYVQTSGPISTFVYDQGSVTLTAVDQVIDNVSMVFKSWADDPNAGRTRTITHPNQDVGYTINYTGTPGRVENVFMTTVIQYNPVVLSWTDHQSAQVNYQIWRKPDNSALTLVATVPHGITTWTDPDYLWVNGGTRVSYDVRANFVPQGNLSEANGFVINAMAYKKGEPILAALSTPTEYKVGNFPNPFNPTTTISFQTVDDANITLEIVDVTGRSIASLVNEFKNAGYYSVRWNGKDSFGVSAASGVYFYSFRATPIIGKEIVTKSGKLLLTK